MLWGNGRENQVLQENGVVQVHPGRKFRNAEELRLGTQFVSRFPKQTKRFTLDHCFSKCGPWTNIINITWDLVRNTNSMAKLKTNWIRTSTVSLPILCVQSSTGNSEALLSWDKDCQTHGFFSLIFRGCFFFYSQGHEKRNWKKRPRIVCKFHFF